MLNDKTKMCITIITVGSIVLASALIAGCSSMSNPSPSPTSSANTTVAQPPKATAIQTPVYIPTYSPTYTPANSIPTVKPLITQTPSIIVE